MQVRNKMNWQTGILLSLAATVLVFAAAAMAQGPGGCSGHGRGGDFGHGHRLEMLTEKLELTEEQVAAITEIREAGQAKGLELHKEMKRLRNELEGEMLKDEPTEEAALGLVGKIGALQTEIQSNRLENRLEVRRQLTAEQRDKMLLMGESFAGGRGQRGVGHRAGPHGDGECDGSGHHQGRKGARSR